MLSMEKAVDCRQQTRRNRVPSMIAGPDPVPLATGKREQVTVTVDVLLSVL